MDRALKYPVRYIPTNEFGGFAHDLVKKELSDRFHVCHECGYGVRESVDRDIASAQEICNRGIEKHSTQGLWGKEIGYQVGLSAGPFHSRPQNLGLGI